MRVMPLTCVGLAVACSIACSTNKGASEPTVRQEGPSGIAAGDESTCLLTQAGSAYCWGADTSGALGDGTSVGVELTPIAVTGSHTYTEIAVQRMPPATATAEGCRSVSPMPSCPK